MIIWLSQFLVGSFPKRFRSCATASNAGRVDLVKNPWPVHPGQRMHDGLASLVLDHIISYQFTSYIIISYVFIISPSIIIYNHLYNIYTRIYIYIYVYIYIYMFFSTSPKDVDQLALKWGPAFWGAQVRHETSWNLQLFCPQHPCPGQLHNWETQPFSARCLYITHPALLGKHRGIPWRSWPWPFVAW